MKKLAMHNAVASYLKNLQKGFKIIKPMVKRINFQKRAEKKVKHLITKQNAERQKKKQLVELTIGSINIWKKFGSCIYEYSH